MKLAIRNQWHRLLVRAFALIALSAVTFRRHPRAPRPKPRAW